MGRPQPGPPDGRLGSVVSERSAHYQAMKIQPWEVWEAWLSPEQVTGAYLANCLKYLGRFNVNAPHKGGLDDLYKARDYLNRLIALEEEA